ncbi:MAG: 4-hydroxy-tetrahydrodipicolinate synthase [Phenylobacterium sp.]|jgi:4-hydroxy-tetrahydrodipicolinate synthase
MFKGSIVALVTPMLDDGSVDFASMGKLIEYHIENGTDGIVAVGTTGESATLSFDEQQQVVQYVVEVVGGRVPVIAGNGTNNTAEAIVRTKTLEKLGVDGFLTVVPYYNKPSQKGLIAHFTAIAGSTCKPVLLYNVPGRTVTDLLPETVMALAKIDNIVGIKEATGDLARLSQIKALCCQAPDEPFCLLSGDDPSALEFMRLGGDGVISVTANVAAKEMADLCDLALQGQFVAAQAVNEKLAVLHTTLFIAPNPTPAKWVLQQLGLITDDNVRLPLLTLEPIHHNDVKDAIKMAGLI